MTSGYKLIAIIVVWGATALVYAMFTGMAITRFLEASTITLLTVVILTVAAVATFFIAWSRPNA